MPNPKADFGGYATKINIKCSDGRTIRKGAFDECDGMTVPLVWAHQHNSPSNVLGHALLEKREDGYYAWGFFNDTPNGMDAKEAVRHGDIRHLSIYANRLEHASGTRDVVHGKIIEVSLVQAGANPGAVIDNPVLAHSDEVVEDEAIIYNDNDTVIEHCDSEESEETLEHEDADDNKEGGERTVQDVLKTMNEEQLKCCSYLVEEALKTAGAGESAEHSDNGGNSEMKHSVFDQTTVENNDEYLSHDEVEAIFRDAKGRVGSLKDAFLMHAEEADDPESYGIKDIEWLFPDFKNVSNVPDFIKRPDDWVSDVMNGVKHIPFSRVKSMHADITEDEARAKGYIKGKRKKDEVFTLLKRATDPQTIYKKQRLDRDDILDITSFDVVAWLKVEMRMMLNEEIARAILVSDGRLSSDDDKIQEVHVRPIWKDDPLYTIRKSFSINTSGKSTEEVENETAKAFIRNSIKARKDYRGSGNPVCFMTDDLLTNCLLLEDENGRVIYDTEDKLRTRLRASKIVTVPVMEGLTRQDSDTGKTLTLQAIFVNLNDYSVGADKGGEINMFDDFDIDFNQYKYLIETRISGALTKPFSAIAIEADFQ